MKQASKRISLATTVAAAALIATAAIPTIAQFASAPAFAAVDTEESQRYYQLGVEAARKGQIGDAIIQLRNALQRDPDNLDARLALGRMHLAANDPVSAEKELRRVMERRPSDEAEALLGRALLRQGRTREVLDTVARDALTDRERLEKLDVRADALVSLNRLDEALDHYNEIVKLDSSDIRGRYGLARVQTLMGKLDVAEATVYELLQEKPDFAEGWLLKGEISLNQGKRNDAKDSFDRAVELAPRNINARVARARALLAMGRPNDARADADEVIRLQPDSPIGQYLMASVAFAEGDIAEANQHFQRVQEVFRDFPPAMLLGALIKYKSGEFGQSERLLTDYVNKNPDSVAGRRALGVVRLRLQGPQSAIDMLKPLVDADPNDLASLQYLASAYLRIGDSEKAAEAYRKLAEANRAGVSRRASAALTLLGEAAGVPTTGEGGEAAAPPKLEGAPQVNDPEGFSRDILLALDYINGSDLDAARSLIRKMKRDYPGNPVVYDIDGRLAAARGEYKEAREAYNEALKYDPEFLSALQGLSALDKLDGGETNYEERLRGLLEQRPESENLVIALSRYYAEQGRWSDALDELQRQRTRLPKAKHLREVLARGLIVRGEPSQAVAVIAELQALAPNDPEVARFAVDAYAAAGEKAKAVDAARKLATLKSDDVGAHLLLAQMLINADNRLEAKVVLEGAAKAFPANPDITRARIQVALAGEDNAGAMAIAEEMTRADPIVGAQFEALVLLNTDKGADAVKRLEAALKEHDVGQLAVDLYAVRRQVEGDEKALAGLTEWRGKHPEDRTAAFAHANALIAVERYADADQLFRALVSGDPENAILLNNLAWARFKLGASDALDYAQRALQLAPNSPAIADTVGWIMMSRGEKTDGLRVLQSAASGAPGNPDIQYHLAYAMADAGQVEDARAVLERILKDFENFSERKEATDLLSRLSGS